MGSPSGTIYEFAEFRLIPSEGLLLREGKPIALSLKAFSTLAYLVERHGHLITKSELMDVVWNATAVEESAVSRCIWTIRHALGEDSRSQQFIQTVSRRGYRFVAAVSVLNDRPSAGMHGSTFVSTGFRLPVGGERVASERGIDADVLETAEAGSAGNGMQDADVPEILRKIEHARPAGAFELTRRRSLYLMIVVVLLGVAAIYINFGRGPYVAGDTSTAPQISGAAPKPGMRGTTNEEAYRLYFQAINLSEERGIQNLEKALEYMQRAVDLDPNYAAAWAGIAQLHRDFVGHGDPGERERYQRSMEAIGRSLAIDPNLSEAYSALCGNKLRYEYDLAGAEAACRKAIELDQNSPSAHKALAFVFSAAGRSEEAIVQINTAMDLQPVSYSNQQIYALTLYFGRRHEDEEAQWRRLAELNPNHSYIYGRLAICLKQQGKEAEAFEYVVKKLAIDKADAKVVERFRTVYFAAGWPGVLREQINWTETRRRTEEYDLACLYTALGDKNKAFENLEKAYVRRSHRIAMVAVDPQLDKLRDDERYTRLIERIRAGR